MGPPQSMGGEREMGNSLESPCSAVLNRPGNRILPAQSARGQARPIRFAQKFPRQQHHVRAAVTDDFVRMRWFGDAADRRRREARLPPDAFGKRRLITRADGNFRVWRHSARAAIDQVHPLRLQVSRQHYRLLEVPRALHPVRARNPHAKGNRSGQTARTARVVSSKKRTRFSKLPP